MTKRNQDECGNNYLGDELGHKLTPQTKSGQRMTMLREKEEVLDQFYFFTGISEIDFEV